MNKVQLSELKSKAEKSSKVMDNLLVHRAEFSDMRIVVADQRIHVLRIRDTQVVVVLLRVHAGQVVVEGRHKDPCYSRGKSTLASKTPVQKYVRCRGLQSPPAISNLQSCQ